MAEQVGSIEYSVRFEVAEVLASSKTFEKSLDQVESAAAKADKMIAELSKETSGLGTKMTATAAGVKAATSGMGNMRGMAQNLGYQLQDVAVQAQMGASWFTIIGQQGSQLLSAIGPAGAVAGALLAVGAAAGSALAPSLMKAKDSAADLEVALDDLKKVVGTTADDTDVLTERVLKLAAANREAAKTEVALGITKAKDAIAASSDIIGEAITKADGWTNATGSMSKAVSQLPALAQIMDRFGVSQAEALDGNIPAEFQRRIEALSTYIGTLGEEFGMTRSQALQFVQAADEFTRLKTPEAATKLATTINSINEANGYANRSLVELGAAVGENTRTMQDAADKANILTSALSGIEQAAKQSEEAIARNSSAIKGLIESATMEAETLGKSERARALYVAGLAKAKQEELDEMYREGQRMLFEGAKQNNKEMMTMGERIVMAHKDFLKLREQGQQKVDLQGVKAEDAVELAKVRASLKPPKATGGSGSGGAKPLGMDKLISSYTQQALEAEAKGDTGTAQQMWARAQAATELYSSRRPDTNAGKPSIGPSGQITTAPPRGAPQLPNTSGAPAAQKPAQPSLADVQKMYPGVPADKLREAYKKKFGVDLR